MPQCLSTIRSKVTRLDVYKLVLIVYSFSHCSLLCCSVLTVMSKEDGSFRLENMTAGTYTIRVNKELMFFETVTVKIAPNTPQLPDIITAGYDRPVHLICTQLHVIIGLKVIYTFHVSATQTRLNKAVMSFRAQVQCVWPDFHQPPA